MAAGVVITVIFSILIKSAVMLRRIILWLMEGHAGNNMGKLPVAPASNSSRGTSPTVI